MIAPRQMMAQIAIEEGRPGTGAAVTATLRRKVSRFRYPDLAVHPAYANLRQSPGFLALEKRMGLEGVSPHQVPL
jgi:hypothetical protein